MPNLLLLIALLGAAGAPEVYRWEMPDGSIQFSDRPAGRNLKAGRVRAANVVPALPAVKPRVSRRLSIRDPRPVATPETKRVTSKHCRALREAVGLLWQQRRRGYRAGEGARLRAELRTRQAELREACGVWR